MIAFVHIVDHGVREPGLSLVAGTVGEQADCHVASQSGAGQLFGGKGTGVDPRNGFAHRRYAMNFDRPAALIAMRENASPLGGSKFEL